jgi:hypothetical protein
MKPGLGMLATATFLLLAQGCAQDSVHRSMYGTLQNIQEQRCREDPTLECPKAESYDEYQRQRKATVRQ